MNPHDRYAMWMMVAIIPRPTVTTPRDRSSPRLPACVEGVSMAALPGTTAISHARIQRCDLLDPADTAFPQPGPNNEHPHHAAPVGHTLASCRYWPESPTTGPAFGARARRIGASPAPFESAAPDAARRARLHWSRDGVGPEIGQVSQFRQPRQGLRLLMSRSPGRMDEGGHMPRRLWSAMRRFRYR